MRATRRPGSVKGATAARQASISAVIRAGVPGYQEPATADLRMGPSICGWKLPYLYTRDKRPVTRQAGKDIPSSDLAGLECRTHARPGGEHVSTPRKRGGGRRRSVVVA